MMTVPCECHTEQLDLYGEWVALPNLNTFRLIHCPRHAEVKVVRLEAALKKYGRHLAECDRVFQPACPCGFADAQEVP